MVSSQPGSYRQNGKSSMSYSNSISLPPRVIINLLRSCAFIAWCFACAPFISGQTSDDSVSLPDTSTQQTEDSPPTAEWLTEQKDKLDEVVERLRDCLKRARTAQYSYIAAATLDDSETWHEAHDKAVAEGKKIKRELFDIAYPLILHSPQLDENLIELGKMMLVIAYHDHQYERAFQLGCRMNELDPSEDVHLMLMRAAMLTNRFEMAAEFREKSVSKIPNLPKLELSMLKTLPDLIRIGQEERKYRLADEKSDLPLVKLETTEGAILVELYEDQYPDTVGHFIYLVEGGFFNNLIFHRVTKNYLPFCVAQTGQFTMQDIPGEDHKAVFSLDIGYQIYDEPPVDGSVRRHLRGVLSLMVREGKDGKRLPNSASSNFLITLVPTPALDGHQVAFGRVISGMEIVDKIQPTLEISADDGKETPLENPHFTAILKAEVIRKRNHEYQPHKVTEK
jgi:cyclophilin family peptidyl-prolyl cis-trans isomerase